MARFVQQNPGEGALIAASMGLPSPLGDVAGLAGDVLGMVKRPEDRTWGNAGMALAGLVPGIAGAGVIRAMRGAPQGMVGGPSIVGNGGGVMRSVRAAPSQGLLGRGDLSQVPDVPQGDLPRYQPARGVPEATEQQWEAARPRLPAIAERGAEMGGREWYNTEPLRHAFVTELGDTAGNAAHRRYLDYVAATSPRSKVGENIRNASYYYGLEAQGRALPEVGGKLPAPYGHYAQRLHQMNAQNLAGGGAWDSMKNPKPAAFAENLAGNQRPVTIDTHNSRVIGLTDPQGRPKDLPKKNEYGFLERVQQEEAAKLGMTPAQWQASLWVGAGKETGLKSAAEPFVDTFEARVFLTAEKRGKSPESVLRDFIRGKAPLLGLGGASALAYPFVDKRKGDGESGG
jgi:hypothetical protein